MSVDLTYSIVETGHGDHLACYESRGAAIRAVANAVREEPAAADSIVIIGYDADGIARETVGFQEWI